MKSFKRLKTSTGASKNTPFRNNKDQEPPKASGIYQIRKAGEAIKPFWHSYAGHFEGLEPLLSCVQRLVHTSKKVNQKVLAFDGFWHPSGRRLLGGRGPWAAQWQPAGQELPEKHIPWGPLLPTYIWRLQNPGIQVCHQGAHLERACRRNKAMRTPGTYAKTRPCLLVVLPSSSVAHK